MRTSPFGTWVDGVVQGTTPGDHVTMLIGSQSHVVVWILAIPLHCLASARGTLGMSPMIFEIVLDNVNLILSTLLQMASNI